MDAQVIPEETFTRMMQGAIGASIQAEAVSKAILGQVTGSNGKATVIHLPGQNPVFLNAPNDRQVLVHLANVLAILLQTTRVLAVALNDLDSRLRLSQAPKCKVCKEPALHFCEASISGVLGATCGVPLCGAHHGFPDGQRLCPKHVHEPDARVAQEVVKP